MLKTCLCFIVFFISTLFISSAFSFSIKRMSVPPKTDGGWKETEWLNASQGDLQEYKKASVTNTTHFYAGYDDRNLYVAFKCNEDSMGQIRTLYTHLEERDNAIYNDDCVEILLDPFANGKVFYHWIVNSAGIVYDAKATSDGTCDLLWDSTIRAVTYRAKSFWVVMIVVPFSDLGFTPQGGEVWRGNFCREEKPRNELSSLFPTGQFNTPETFGELDFEPPVQREAVRLISLADKGENQIRFRVNNQSGIGQAFRFKVKNYGDGRVENSYQNQVEKSVSAGESAEVLLPYEMRPESQLLDVSVLNLTTGQCVYQNQIQLSRRDKAKMGESDKVWRISDPLYCELFSNEPAGLANEGGIYWWNQINNYLLRPFAERYGFRYVYEEAYSQNVENKLYPFQNSPMLNLPALDTVRLSKKYGMKNILLMRWDGFLPDPKIAQLYLQEAKTTIGKYSEVLWGVGAGDEACEIVESEGIKLFSEKKSDGAYILQADSEVKGNYGAGKYGIPLSMTDSNPYRWIAYRRWLNDKMSNLQDRLFKMVKETDPKVKVISYDPVGRHRPFDFSRWGKSCDIVTHQLYPRSSPYRADFGFITKLVKDISGAKEVWPCPHIENYANKFTPEEVLELISQVFRNGGTGLHYFLLDTNGCNANNDMYSEFYGAPERWQIEMELLRESGRMKRLKFPASDFAILYSCDSYMAQPPGTETDEIEYAYTFLGPVARSWFTFIDDNQIDQKMDLSQYKAIYVPLGTYTRRSVVMALEKYVAEGGILISGDPEIFSYDIDGTPLDSFRVELFGVHVKDAINQPFIQCHGQNLPLFARAFTISPAEGVKVKTLAQYPDGRPAIVSQTFGKGKTFFFASNPFTLKGIADDKWKAFFKSFQTQLGLETRQDIWRFQFPRTLIKPPVPPEGKCLTNNHVFWRNFIPYSTYNQNTVGTYQYTLSPEAISDQNPTGPIPFSTGRLTDRPRAIVTQDMNKLPARPWVVRWCKSDPFGIIFDFKKSFPLDRVHLFFSNQLPEITFSGSNDGNVWKKIPIIATAQDAGDDIFDKTISGPFGTWRYLRMEMGPRTAGKSMVLAEIEIWMK